MGVLQEAVLAAAGRTDVHQAVADVYLDLQREIDVRRPVCKTSGRCCHFDAFGHRLYVTTMELAVFVSSGEVKPSPEAPGGCPFQINGLCSVHAVRPFGCRVFFCDSTSDEWQHEQYEQFHTRLKNLHDVMEVPYFYVEWRRALKELHLATPREADAGANRLSLPQVRL